MRDEINYNVNYGDGIGFVGALTILFIALKLLDKIDWSWWWVLSPIWISFLIGFVIILIGLAIMELISLKW